MSTIHAHKFLVVIAGPTAIGKTALSIELAQHYNTQIISADSRQFYKEMKIGTAVPADEELTIVPHHFIAHLSIKNEYNAGMYETDALKKIDELFREHDVVLLTGGSGLFIDAVCNGFDTFDEIPKEIREEINQLYEKKGLEWLQEEVKKCDPEYYSKADTKNPHRLIRALEVCRGTGKPYSSFKTGQKKERPFTTIKVLLNTERAIVYERINKRTDEMMKKGWLEEAKQLFPFRHLNALNTVGYKELFQHLEEKISLEKAVELIKQNTRRYAKRQLTWFRNDVEFTEFLPEDKDKIIAFIDFVISHS